MVARGDGNVGHGVEGADDRLLQGRMRLVDGGVDDGDPDILAASIVGRQRDVAKGIVDHAARRLLQIIDVVGHALADAGVAGKLGKHDADSATVGNAEAHDRAAEQSRRAASGRPARRWQRCLRRHWRRLRRSPALVGHESAGDGAHSCGRLRKGKRRGSWSGARCSRWQRRLVGQGG